MESAALLSKNRLEFKLSPHLKWIYILESVDYNTAALVPFLPAEAFLLLKEGSIRNNSTFCDTN